MSGHEIILFRPATFRASLNCPFQRIGPAGSRPVFIDSTAVTIQKRTGLLLVFRHKEHCRREKRMTGISQPCMTTHKLLGGYGKPGLQPDNIIRVEDQVEFAAAGHVTFHLRRTTKMKHGIS
jgi:hypothetical protein